jgi:hypothetical protein
MKGRLEKNVLIRQRRNYIWSKVVIVMNFRKIFYLHVLACKLGLISRRKIVYLKLPECGAGRQKPVHPSVSIFRADHEYMNCLKMKHSKNTWDQQDS